MAGRVEAQLVATFGKASLTTSEAFRLIGTPVPGGILVVSDHASNRVPDDIDLGVDPALLTQHVAIDIGVDPIGQIMAEVEGVATFQGNVSRLVCDFNRDRDSAGVVPLASDGHAIPGNDLSPEDREARIARYFDPYHTALAALLEEANPALVVSLHSFTPALATCEKPRPWQVGVLYNQDDRAARVAIRQLEMEGLVVGDQEPYSGVLLNATMNRHCESFGRPYVGIELRQDMAGRESWQPGLARMLVQIARQAVRELE
ncbi:N-formylglutamate amidohydrolase [Altererythrobacter buctensis]|uniref:N-formylglutamate amidohydrolase n=1 Tax=Alteraurantiacibacter buctensis TaxID=1503981 RepID=A0A844Z007_9SPHN|nr:N-formylglutamate amidohydrolase [Alteraurantiacibacter buctensis]